MARPTLPLGTFGSITTEEVRPGVYRARTRFRDFDGVTRQVMATGRSAAAATRELKAKIADRSAPTGDLISPDMRDQPDGRGLAVAVSRRATLRSNHGERVPTDHRERHQPGNRQHPTARGISWTTGEADQVAGLSQPTQEDEDGPQDDVRRGGHRRCGAYQPGRLHLATSQPRRRTSKRSRLRTSTPSAPRWTLG